MRDKESMEALLRAAERDGTVDVTVVRPPALTDGPRTGRYTTGADVRIRLTSSIARADVADFLLRSAVTGSYVGRAPRIAGAAPPWSTRQRRAGTRPAARRLPPATTLRQAR
jgi:thioester reductase-like protein